MVEGIVVYSIGHLPDQAKKCHVYYRSSSYEVGFIEDMVPCDGEQLRAAIESFMSRPEYV